MTHRAQRFRCHSKAPCRGFTLLELSLAIAVLILLAAGAFSLAAGSLELLDDVQSLQNRENRTRRFVELCRQNFESLPVGAEVSCRFEERGGHYDTYLSISGSPSAFGFSRGDAEIRRILLASEVASSGFIQANVYYLDDEADLRYQRGDLTQLKSRSLTLMPRLQQLSWRFFDPATNEWKDEWKEGLENPLMIELTLAGAGESDPVRSVFWIPARKLGATSSIEPATVEDNAPDNPTPPAIEDRLDSSSSPSPESPPVP